jgi:hypothetical protein
VRADEAREAGMATAWYAAFFTVDAAFPAFDQNWERYPGLGADEIICLDDIVCFSLVGYYYSSYLF